MEQSLPVRPTDQHGKSRKLCMCMHVDHGMPEGYRSRCNALNKIMMEAGLDEDSIAQNQNPKDFFNLNFLL